MGYAARSVTLCQHDGMRETACLVSVGYEGRDVADLIASLQENRVHVLVDVRLTPLSRKRGLSKTALSLALESAGIRYVHHRQLGNPKDNRDEFRKGSETSRDRYRQLLHEPAAMDALRHVSELLDEGVVALLCFERDHAQCHRGLVADALAVAVAGHRDVQLVHA